MKTLILMPLLFCTLAFGFPAKQEAPAQQHEQLKGSWQTVQMQVQYIVDSHLVYEREIAAEKGNVYTFEGKVVRVKHPDGTTAQGTYTVVKEAEEKQVILQLPGTSATYTLIALTPTRMVWQRDLEDVFYNEGATQKSAERAIYTEVLVK